MPAGNGRWFPGGKKRQRDQSIRVLTASATRLDLTNRKEARRQRALRQGWELDAWAYRNSIGELRYAINFLANSMGRMRIYPAAYSDDGDTDLPIPLDAAGAPPQIIAACEQAMKDLGNGKLAIAGLLHSLSTNISICGEAYLLGQEDPMTGVQSWTVRSVSEILVYDDTFKLREVPMDPQGILGWIDLDPALTVVSRMWVSDPQFRILSDSPMRAIMDDCESLLILRRMIRATGRSRLAARGILGIPDELSITVPVDDNEDPAADPFDGPFQQAIMAPISDEGVAGAVVPVVIRGPGDIIKQIVHIDFASTFDEMSIKNREELIGVIATGLDLPKEVISGVADLNHWSAWNVDDNTFRHHIEPHVITGVDCLTGAYLRPYLQNCDQIDPAILVQWVERCLFWYDPTELVTPPDMSATAATAQDAILISDEAARRYMGFTEADAPTPDEFMARLISKQRTWPANLTMGVVHGIDPGLTIPPMVGPPALPGIKSTGVDVGLAPVVPGTPAVPSTTPPIAGDEPPKPPPPSTPGPPPPPAVTASAKPKPSEKSLRLSRKLSQIDHDLRARLQTAANAAMLRQLEKAGGRLRSKVAKDETLRTKIALTRKEHVAAILGKKTVEEMGLTASGLMGGAWDALKAQWMSWTGAAQKQAIANAAQLAGVTTDDESVVVAQTALAKGLDDGWTVLENALTEMSQNLLYNPDPNVADLAAADFNPDTLVPAGTIRAALGVAGGYTQDLATITTKAGDTVTVPAGVPVGEIGNGVAIQNLITGNGPQIAGYVWNHGMSLKPLPCHTFLDDVEFASFADPVLSPAENDEWDGFPEVEFLIPGDHAGCSCEWTTLYADEGNETSDTTTDTGDTDSEGDANA
jgi:hypothetical protein